MKKIVENIPDNPGVYFMKNDTGKIIYVGKAKNLKKRVSSYFTRGNLETKTLELVKNIQDIEYIITSNEVEALILENNLIKKHKPKYNILLKDEKTYPYIKISREDFPKIEIVRAAAKIDREKADYFGPFPTGIYYFIKMLKKTFPLRTCNRDMSKNYERPCLKYFMKYCLGPCVYKNSSEEYKKMCYDLKKLLGGNGKEIIKKMTEKMEEHSLRLEYEEAIIYRSRIKELEIILQKQFTEYGFNIDEDIFILREVYDTIFILVLSIRDGKVIDKNFVTIKNKLYVSHDIFEDVFTSYYNERPTPKNIILDKKYKSYQEKLANWLFVKYNRKHEFFFPEIQSRRKELFDIAELNINKEIETYIIKTNMIDKGLDILKEKLELKIAPFRIECFDISNIQGKDAVAAMSVAINGHLSKKEYRKYKIKTMDTPDDFKMMEEVLTRRYSKLNIEELPQVILVDGGKGQLSVAEKVLKKLGKYSFVDIISIAKKEEMVYKTGIDEPFVMDINEEALKILQRLRDEAHRFGITYHRKLRSKRVLRSKLDEIDGIGEKRKILLLKKFGSYEKVLEADVEELRKVVPINIALEIKKNLN